MTLSKFSRRRFIQGMTGASLAGVLPAVNSAHAASDISLPSRAIGRPFPEGVDLPTQVPPSPSANSIGVALMGLGRYGLDKMAPALTRSKHCHLAAVVSGNRGKAERVAKAYGLPQDAIYNYDNFDQIIKDDRIQAVYVVLPSGLHAEWTEKAFAAGKHVLCENPMALSANECERMISAGKRANKKLMIGYRCHFEPNNLMAMQMMRDKVIGNIQVIRTDQHYDIGNVSPADDWRVNRALAGGGALEDYGLYGLQAALYLTGEMPINVSATATTPHGKATFREIVNLVSSRFTFPSGAIAQLATSYSATWKDRVGIHGDNGIMLMHPATAYSGIRMSLQSSPKAGDIETQDASIQFSAMLDHFGESIKKDSTIKTGGEMGLRDIRLIEAIYQSAATGKQIDLNPDGTMIKI